MYEFQNCELILQNYPEGGTIRTQAEFQIPHIFKQNDTYQIVLKLHVFNKITNSGQFIFYNWNVNFSISSHIDFACEFNNKLTIHGVTHLIIFDNFNLL